jgi:hypothetical protein
MMEHPTTRPRRGSGRPSSPPSPGVICRSRDSPMVGCPSEGRLSLFIRTAWPKGILPLTQARLRGPGRWVGKNGVMRTLVVITWTVIYL